MNEKMQKELASVRAEIDAIDNELLSLLNRRVGCAQKVGEIKSRYGEADHIYRPEREAQVLRRIHDLNPGPLTDEYVTWFFREVMSACLSFEQPLGIAFLGPLGTFSESAASKHFGHAARLLPQLTIDEVFREVEGGRAHFAVVPVENSTEGAVGRTMDLLLTTSLKICGEVNLRVHQHLLTQAENLEQVTKVYSHAQSLAQCHEWLNRMLPKAQRISVGSNAYAAQLAAGEANAAAIAGDAAALRFSLPKLVESIEDEPNNTTRFLVLGHRDAGPSGKDKTSLILSAPNRSGALQDLLLPFAKAGASLSRLESRPARHALWEYVFYVDIEGHSNDPAVKAALQDLAQRAAYMKILGSYPVAVY